MENIALNSTSVLERQEIDTLGDSSSPRTRSRLISMASAHAHASQTKKETVKQVGSPTECALLEFAGDMGYDYQRIRNEKLLEETDVSRDKGTGSLLMLTQGRNGRRCMHA